MMQEKIAFIGGGNMAEGIIKAMLEDKTIAADNISVYDVVPARLDYLSKEYKINVIADLDAAIKEHGVLFVAVRPQDTECVFDQIKDNGGADALVVSICAGITLDTMSKAINENGRMARVMPNVLVEAKHGYTAICASEAVSDADKETLESMFGALGQTMFIAESQFDAFTAFSCAGPAYILHCISGMIDAGVHAGFSRPDARRMVLENFIGSAKVLELTGEHPFERVDKMTSPAGVTIEGVSVLNKSGLTGILMETVAAAMRRTEELA